MTSTGARQVGKTYTITQFGRQAYESFIPLNFIESPELKAVFAGDLASSEIKKRMSLLIPGIAFVPHSTLLFLDEIQECPEARTALKFLAQDESIDVIASGSLLGLSYRDQDASALVPHGADRHRGLQLSARRWRPCGADSGARRVGKIIRSSEKRENDPQMGSEKYASSPKSGSEKFIFAPEAGSGKSSTQRLTFPVIVGARRVPFGLTKELCTTIEVFPQLKKTLGSEGQRFCGDPGRPRGAALSFRCV